MPDLYTFDYTNQAWLNNGRYVRCGHKGCKVDAHGEWTIPEGDEHKQSCYGTRHLGEKPNLTAEVH